MYFCSTIHCILLFPVASLLWVLTEPRWPELSTKPSQGERTSSNFQDNIILLKVEPPCKIKETAGQLKQNVRVNKLRTSSQGPFPGLPPGLDFLKNHVRFQQQQQVDGESGHLELWMYKTACDIEFFFCSDFFFKILIIFLLPDLLPLTLPLF